MLSDAARTRRVIIVCSGWQQRWRGFSYCTFVNLVDGCSGSAAASSEVSLLLWTCISPPGRQPVLIPLSHFFLISWFVSPGNRKRPRPRPAIFPLYLFLRLWGWKKNNNNTMNKTSSGEESAPSTQDWKSRADVSRMLDGLKGLESEAELSRRPLWVWVRVRICAN